MSIVSQLVASTWQIWWTTRPTYRLKKTGMNIDKKRVYIDVSFDIKYLSYYTSRESTLVRETNVYSFICFCVWIHWLRVLLLLLLRIQQLLLQLLQQVLPCIRRNFRQFPQRQRKRQIELLSLQLPLPVSSSLRFCSFLSWHRTWRMGCSFSF